MVEGGGGGGGGGRRGANILAFSKVSNHWSSESLENLPQNEEHEPKMCFFSIHQLE